MASLGSPGKRNRRGPPQLASRIRVVARDEAAFLLESLAAVDPADHDAVRNQRACGMREAFLVIGLLRSPQQSAGARLERDQRCVIGREKDLVLVDRDGASRPAERLNRVGTDKRTPRSTSPFAASSACTTLPG